MTNNIYYAQEKVNTDRDRCFDELVSGVLFEVEAFDAYACADDDLWPCVSKSDKRYQTPLALHPEKHTKAKKRVKLRRDKNPYKRNKRRNVIKI